MPGLFLLSLFASFGIFFFYCRRSKTTCRLEPAMPRPVSTGTAQKETHFIPKLNRMPDGWLGVKAAGPICAAKFGR
jgi:hypothetical protein